MLHAALQGKVSVNAGKDENGHITHMNEDSLTAIVFGLMTYLPGEVAWKLLQRSVPDLPPYKVGYLELAEFWPAWSPQGKNVYRTEPDAYFRFKMGDPDVTIDIIVETKRHAKAHQDVEQWRQQIEAYRHTILLEESSLPDRVFYLAVSGLAKGRAALEQSANLPDELEPKPKIVFCNWTDISNAARRLRDEGTRPAARIMSMIMQGLARGGFVERLYFASLTVPKEQMFQKTLVRPLT